MASSGGHTPFQNLRISELEKVFKGHLAQAALSTFYRHLLIWKLCPSTKLRRGCLGLGQADKPALSPTLPLTSARLPEFKEGMWRLRGRVTQPFNRDTAHNGKIWEFQRERKPERPRQLPRRESQLRTNLRAKKKPWGKKKKSLSWERAIVYAQGQKRLAEQRGSPTCWDSPERVLFLLSGFSKLPASSVPGQQAPSGLVREDTEAWQPPWQLAGRWHRLTW